MPEAKRSLGNLSPAIQVVVKNRMNLDNNHWEHFFKFNPADGTFSSIGNAMGVSPLELTALLTLARSCMIHTSPAPDPQVSTLLAGLMDLLKSQPAVRKEALATMPPPEDEQALRQRLSLELEAKKTIRVPQANYFGTPQGSPHLQPGTRRCHPGFFPDQPRGSLDILLPKR
jgi:hypothetical protein